ncbi:hypothetical protein AVEN_198017-1 [Araneus ventricosus]|uniref:Uncharacterized protein n=1 Tax=Araneus ventricosus TaxID=182803 RepID=A0A4Y2PHC8_ARAVE|nr:hypothetical protein AVEN_198017-1 [Araneus ventricosus]
MHLLQHVVSAARVTNTSQSDAPDLRQSNIPRKIDQPTLPISRLQDTRTCIPLGHFLWGYMQNFDYENPMKTNEELNEIA